jgi:hypothetical protein
VDGFWPLLKMPARRPPMGALMPTLGLRGGRLLSCWKALLERAARVSRTGFGGSAFGS